MVIATILVVSFFVIILLGMIVWVYGKFTDIQLRRQRLQVGDSEVLISGRASLLRADQRPYPEHEQYPIYSEKIPPQYR